MTKKVFKSLPRLLESREIYTIKTYYLDSNSKWSYDKWFQYPADIVIEKDIISFIVKQYYFWKSSVNHPTVYENYKVLINRKDIQSIEFYVPIRR